MLRILVAATAAACLAVAATSAPSASAAEMKDGGTVTYVTTWKEATKQPDGTTTFRNRLDGVLQSANATSPFHLATQTCFGTTLIGADGKPGNASGYCHAVSKEGDNWWLSWTNSAAGRTWQHTAGTGKFEGIKANGTTEVLLQTPDGRVVLSWEGTFSFK